MSKNYYYTNQSFHLTEHKVKQIIQAEIEDFFSCIKDEIENKIKQIDRNILDLKADLRKIQNNNSASLSEITVKVNELYGKIQEMQTTSKKQMEKMSEEIRNKAAIDRSLEKRQQRSPLFRRSNATPSVDLNTIIFGEENAKALSSTLTVQEKVPELKIYPPSKPPLQKMKNQSKAVKNQPVTQVQKMSIKMQQPPIAKFLAEENQTNHENVDQNSNCLDMDEKVRQNLNKNKNSFLRKKSVKKFNTIPQEEVQQSILSS